MAGLVDEIHTIPESAPTCVVSAGTALNEAIYFLCHPNPFEGKEKKCDPVPLSSAKSLLRRLVVNDYIWSGPSLRDAVAQLVDKVFQAGTADSLIQYIRGHLTSEIRDKQTRPIPWTASWERWAPCLSWCQWRDPSSGSWRGTLLPRSTFLHRGR